MHFESTIKVRVEPDSVSVGVAMFDRAVLVQHVATSRRESELRQVRFGLQLVEVHHGWIVPPSVVLPGIQVAAELCNRTSVGLDVELTIIGITVPVLTADRDGGLSGRECARMLGSYLGGLAMVAPESAVREALAWWAWHDSRLAMVYQANREIETMEAAEVLPTLRRGLN